MQEAMETTGASKIATELQRAQGHLRRFEAAAVLVLGSAIAIFVACILAQGATSRLGATWAISWLLVSLWASLCVLSLGVRPKPTTGRPRGRLLRTSRLRIRRDWRLLGVCAALWMLALVAAHRLLAPPQLVSVAVAAILQGLLLAYVSIGAAVAARLLAPLPVISAGVVLWHAGAAGYEVMIVLTLGAALWAAGCHAVAGWVHLREQTLRSLIASTDELERTSQIKTRLLLEASHDLRQPVHALVMMVDRLDPNDTPARLQQRFADLQTCVESLADMVINLLDLPKLSSGEYVVDLQPISVDAVLNELDSSFKHIAQRKGLTLVSQRTRAWAHTDPAMLRRILSNLVSNAIKYTRRGGVTLSVTENDDWVRVRVADTGIGIPQGQLARIFEDHVRLDVKDGEAGLGVGLAVVRRMADLLQHRIRVRSEIGGGSIFDIYMRAANPPLVQAPAPEQGRSTNHAGKLFILVEDDDVLRDSCAQMFEWWGAQVIAAESVELALADERLEHGRPDLIVSDLHLRRDGDGFDTIAAIRRAFGAHLVPAILITGDVSASIRGCAQKLQIRTAHKPLRPSSFKQLVDSVLGSHRMSQTQPPQRRSA